MTIKNNGDYKKIRGFISKHQYKNAIDAYYDLLGDEHYGEFYKELIYLKRISKSELIGQDLVFFKPIGSQSDLIKQYFDEFISCIDKALSIRADKGQTTLISILCEYSPTMEELIEKTRKDIHHGVYIEMGKLQRDYTEINENFFGYKYHGCIEGILFDNFPDQVLLNRVIEYPEDPRFRKLWVPYDPGFIKINVYDKKLHLSLIDAYRHKEWHNRGRGSREPDFLTVKSKSEIKYVAYGCSDIRYTGRVHEVEGLQLFEADLVRQKFDKPSFVGTPFREAVEDVLREAENILRESHGLPRIGEGWISETMLYNLVSEIFPDAIQHASPDWLRPQHLDIFIPSQNIAFEYQGAQHYEPIDFFGGEEAFKETKKRDCRKARKCKKNNIKLFLWHHEELIDRDLLIQKLNEE